MYLYKRKVIWYEVLFGAIVVVGLYIIFSVESQYGWGILLALCSAFLGALFSVINGRFVLKHKASVISFYEIFFGMLCITIYLVFSGSFNASFFQLSTNDWIFLLLLASACTAYAFIASIHVMQWISPYIDEYAKNLWYVRDLYKDKDMKKRITKAEAEPVFEEKKKG